MLTMVFAVFYLASLGCLAFGQAPAGAKPSFEVASVKRSTQANADQGMVRGGPGTDDPGRITYVNAPLRLILTMANGINNYQLEGPAWIDTERYDIAANVPPGATKEQCNQMLQNLLVERFRMAVHHETRKFEGYRLVIGKNGAKLKEAPLGSPASPVPEGYPPLPPGRTSGLGVAGGNGTYLLTARQRSLSFLVQMLGVQLHADVDDQTGLTGTYDYNLGFVPPILAKTAGTDGPYPDIFTAVEQQLGLKLVDGKVPLDVLVIDQASKDPVEN